MSHFTVLVVTDNGTDDEIETALAPFHEFECTGVDDRYVQDIDETDDARADYEKRKDDPDYPTFAAFVQGWYGRKPVPHGEEPDLADTHKYGYYTVDEAGEVVKVVNRTNPNRKWDWYQVGGRWSGMIVPKAGTRTGRTGSRSLLDTSAPTPNRVDVIRKGDIDFDTMRAGITQERLDSINKAFDKLREKDASLSDDVIVQKWQQVIDLYDTQLKAWGDAGRPGRLWDFINDRSPELKALREEGIVDLGFGFFNTIPQDVRDPFAWARNVTNALSTYAFLGQDGVWRQRGEMGWFGMSSDEMTTDQWDAEYEKALQAIPDDKYVAVVDCHI